MKCPSCARRLTKVELVMCAACWLRVPGATREQIATLYTNGAPEEFMDAVAAAARTVKVVD